MTIREQLEKGVFLMDGAMGTQLQLQAIPEKAWQGCDGCNEILNLGAPEAVGTVHRAYLEAGADAVETNSFGGSPVTLAEYGLEKKARKINQAAATVARAAADACTTPEHPRFVIGSVGPGTKMPSLGHIAFDELYAGYCVQIEGLLEGGVDGIIIETCQDPLQIKAALRAFEQTAGFGSDILSYVSVTVETTGTLLAGSSIQAVTAILEPYPIDVLGLNCATGPEAMRIHLDYLAAHWPRATACMPNAGMPVMEDGDVHYPLDPDTFSDLLAELVQEVPLNIAGGCCGTTPAHIAALRRRVGGFKPKREPPLPIEQASSLFAPVELTQDPAPLYVGERANASGSRKFRDLLLADEHEKAFTVLVGQEDIGAHVLDLNCAYAGRDEVHDIIPLVGRAARECRAPLMIDSTQPSAIAAALKHYGGRMIVNSINLEAGEDRAGTIADLARSFGAALVCLTIDEKGMAMTAERKLEVAQRLVAFCETHGLRRQDLLIDALTFTVGSGDDSMRDAACETIRALKLIKKELPGVRLILGVSNVSYGLRPPARKILNALFLHRCLKAGLDACIVNVAALASLPELPEEAVQLAGALLDNDTSSGDPLTRYIAWFEETETAVVEEEAEETRSAEDRLHRAVLRGRIGEAEEAVTELLETHRAEAILNDMLLPAMKEVGRLFNDGTLQLPFVLKSAEVMRRSVDLLEPNLEKKEDAEAQGTMVLATVAGDVHDIGKNLVKIILGNNGFKVVDLGTKVPVETMIQALRETNAQVLGMSGLLVKSAALMSENLRALKNAGFSVPVFLGGAALSERFVSESCQPQYEGPVVYCRDAFEGLSRMREHMEEGGVTLPDVKSRKTAPGTGNLPEKVEPVRTLPQPPFFGSRIVEDIPVETLYPFLDEVALFYARWGYRRGKNDHKTHEKLLHEEVRPKMEALKQRAADERLFAPAVVYGYYHCQAAGDALHIVNERGQQCWSPAFPWPTSSTSRTIA
jgi:5-methyltetrahydrofolate--homocysteine methyltransferase